MGYTVATVSKSVDLDPEEKEDEIIEEEEEQVTETPNLRQTQAKHCPKIIEITLNKYSYLNYAGAAVTMVGMVMMFWA